MIEISEDKDGNEELNEVREDISDALVKDFIKYLDSMPEKDHIMVNKKMNAGGVIKRLSDFWDDFRHRDKINSNIFAPTAALYMFQHLNKFIPNHQVVLADFDCFLEPNNLKGINAPLVTNKL